MPGARVATCTAVRSLQDNYIWMLHDARDAVAVDPGDAAPVRDFLSRHGLRLAAILLTHHHADHTGGVAGLLQAGPVPVYGPAGGGIACVTRPVEDGACIAFDRPALRLSVIATPGHTLDHLVYLRQPCGAQPAPWLFCGDTLFSCGCGRVFEGTPQQMVRTLDRLRGLPASTLVHGAHEYTLRNIAFAQTVDPHNTALSAWGRQAARLRRAGRPTLPTSLQLEQAVNPFLRIDDPVVRERVRARFALSSVDRVEVFSALRTARNAFRPEAPAGELT